MNTNAMLTKEDITKCTTIATYPTAGFLFINKPAGWTSHDVIAKLRGILSIRRIGHAGTLDPLATGLLVVGINQATKLLDYWHHFPKTYTAQLEFGKTSNTYDSDGTITTNKNQETLPKPTIEQALTSFIGTQQQMPPAFSAKKVNGKKAYELARAGKPVKLKARQVTFFDITLDALTYPHATISMTCSTGTYVRSLIHDIGQVVGTDAIMTGLTRTAIGPVSVQQAQTLATISPDTYQQLLYSPNSLLHELESLGLE